MNDDPTNGNGVSPEARYIHQMNVLAAIADILTTRTHQTEMLQDILMVLQRQLAMSRGIVMLLDSAGNQLMVEATSASEIPAQQHTAYRRGEGVTGQVLVTGEPEIIPSVLNEPRFQNRIYQRPMGDAQSDFSFICVPIKLGNETLGTLSADTPLMDRPALTELERVLTIVASMISNDIQRRRLSRMERETLEEENERLRNELAERFRPQNIVGNSHVMQDVFTRIHQVAQTDTTVLIRGESGTGKELVAAAIHYNGPRAQKPFIKVNCAALNENLLESELFGHERGAFTGALYARVGRIEEAEGGTLFLDEIGDFSPAIQIKLLRILQEREFEKVGSNKTLRANVRIMAATNKDLEKKMAESSFRADLYYRINVFAIHLPPLRERKSDILLLANHFVRKFATRMRKDIHRISTVAVNILNAYHWPGNVRELENCIEHAALLCKDGVIHGHDLPPTIQYPSRSEAPARGHLKARVAVLERDLLIDALKRHRGRVSAASQELGITARMIRYKIRNLQIDYEGLFRRGARRRRKATGGRDEKA